MRAELFRRGALRSAALAALLAMAGSLSCSIEFPATPNDEGDPARCLLLAREWSDAGDPETALRWAERGIHADPSYRWPELREAAARAAFALGGGDFPNMIDAAAWVLEGGLAGSSPPEIPGWPAGVGPDPEALEIGEAGYDLLHRLRWRFIERAARHLDSLTAAIEDRRVPCARLEDRLVGLYLSHSALRLATGLVLILDGNRDLADGLQDSAAAVQADKNLAPGLDSLLIAGEKQVLDDLHRSLQSAENLRRVRGGRSPLDGPIDLPLAGEPPLDPSLPLDAYVGAVRAVVDWIDRATLGWGGWTEAVPEANPQEKVEGVGPLWNRLLDWLIPPAAAEPLPVRGSIHAPTVEPLASAQGGYQPAGALPDEGFGFEGGEIGWTEDTLGSVRAILKAKGMLEKAEHRSLSEQLRAAGEASRLLEGRVAIVSFLPGRLVYRRGDVAVGIAPVADGVARASTGTLGGPEGKEIERYGCDYHLVVQHEPFPGRSITAGLGIQARTRFWQSTHLQIVPQPLVESSAWERTTELDLRIGVASREGPALVQWGTTLLIPLNDGDRRTDPDIPWDRRSRLSLAARIGGFHLGRMQGFGILDGSIDESFAEGRAGLALEMGNASGLLLRAGTGWEGEFRWGGLLMATTVRRTPGDRPFRSYRLGVSR